MTENLGRNETQYRRWPWIVVGLCGPVLSRVLAAWLPLYLAAGASFFMAFLAAASVVNRSSRQRHARLGRNLAASMVGGAVVALLSYMFPSM